MLFEFLLVAGSDDAEGHVLRDEVALVVGAQVFDRGAGDGFLSAEGEPAERASGEEAAFEVVEYVFGRAVFVRDYFVQHDSALGFHFVLREGGFGGDFKQEADRLPYVFPKDGGVQDYLFLGGVGVQFSAETLEI